MAAKATTTGKVTQVIGSILDAEFPEESMPKIYNALHVNVDRKVGTESHKQRLTCEVAGHLGGGRVRAVALGSTDGLKRGTDIVDTGAPDRKSTRLNSSHVSESRMPSSA